MVMAGQWYESGTFWSVAVGALLTVLGFIVGPLIARRIQEARRRLLFSMPTATPLIRTTRFSAANLEVRHDGRPLSHPHVLEIRLTCQGRHDIPSAMFDGGQPLRLDVGVPIINVLDTDSSPDTAPHPVWAADGTAITIGPSLIKKNQTITFALLVDGPNPQLTCPHPPLIDVDVQPGFSEAPGLRLSMSTVFMATGGLAVLAMVGLVADLVKVLGVAGVTSAVEVSRVLGVLGVLAVLVAWRWRNG
ncbi:hypothetical protein [Micromonospora carbonacea]|uniref:Uncharacterized protein n=1 Tax=Micromonospora carbonacea TaxID=47853 RepID=A0A1C5AXZ3_9ACTN|nr:hypothetical protein [Micromonospora carbonacea]SCF50037.1 hypothetical protein GA0070563_12616 [Micromonospora carbonacea]